MNKENYFKLKHYVAEKIKYGAKKSAKHLT